MVNQYHVLPKLGLGMAALGRPGYINLNRNAQLASAEVRSVEYMQEQSNKVLDEAFRLGVKWFDCARSYGLSEKFVGEYLRNNEVKPGDVSVSSKWGYTYVANWNVTLPEGQPHEVKDHSVETFLRQIKETEEHVGEYITHYQIHSATFESGVLTNKAVHEALDKCRKEKGWRIGLSVSSPKQNEVLREAMKIKTPSGERLFDSVQCTYNLLEQKPGEALQEAHDVGMEIIIKEGLANGRLLQHPKILEASKALNVAPDALSLACILAQPFQPRVLSGSALIEHLTSNHKALEIEETLLKERPEVLKDLMESCCMDSDQYWLDRSALKWN